MRLAYPIILSPFEDGSGGYTVEVPDLPGCVTEGRDLADALLMAEDAASGWVLTELEEGSPAPKASKLSGIRTESSDQLVSMVALDMDSYAAKYGGKAVRTSPFRHGLTLGLNPLASTTAAPSGMPLRRNTRLRFRRPEPRASRIIVRSTFLAWWLHGRAPGRPSAPGLRRRGRGALRCRRCGSRR